MASAISQHPLLFKSELQETPEAQSPCSHVSSGQVRTTTSSSFPAAGTAPEKVMPATTYPLPGQREQTKAFHHYSGDFSE